MTRASANILAGVVLLAAGLSAAEVRGQVMRNSSAATSGGLYGMGRVALLNGRLKGAEKAFTRCREMAEREGDRWTYLHCSLGLGQAARNLHKTTLAGEAFRAALKTAKALAAERRGDANAQEALLKAGKEFGAFSLVNGMPGEAAGAYAAAREAAMALAGQAARPARWLHEAFVCSNRIGDIQMTSGGQEQALAAYHTGLRAARKMVRLEPGEPKWKMDMARAFARLAVAGEAPAENLRKALKILDELKKGGRSVPGLDFWEERLRAALKRAGGKKKGR